MPSSSSKPDASKQTTKAPSKAPSKAPTKQPTKQPTKLGTVVEDAKSKVPHNCTLLGGRDGTQVPSGTRQPTKQPTKEASKQPTKQPTQQPSTRPPTTNQPTKLGTMVEGKASTVMGTTIQRDKTMAGTMLQRDKTVFGSIISSQRPATLAPPGSKSVLIRSEDKTMAIKQLDIEDMSGKEREKQDAW